VRRRWLGLSRDWGGSGRAQSHEVKQRSVRAQAGVNGDISAAAPAAGTGPTEEDPASLLQMHSDSHRLLCSSWSWSPVKLNTKRSPSAASPHVAEEPKRPQFAQSNPAQPASRRPAWPLPASSPRSWAGSAAPRAPLGSPSCPRSPPRRTRGDEPVLFEAARLVHLPRARLDAAHSHRRYWF